MEKTITSAALEIIASSTIPLTTREVIRRLEENGKRFVVSKYNTALSSCYGILSTLAIDFPDQVVYYKLENRREALWYKPSNLSQKDMVMGTELRLWVANAYVKNPEMSSNQMYSILMNKENKGSVAHKHAASFQNRKEALAAIRAELSRAEFFKLFFGVSLESVLKEESVLQK